MKILYFGAEHCCQCKAVKPKFIEAATKHGLKEGSDYEFVDAEENEDLAVKYNVRNLPTIVITTDSEEAAQKVSGGEVWQSLEGIILKYKELCDLKEKS